VSEEIFGGVPEVLASGVTRWLRNTDSPTQLIVQLVRQPGASDDIRLMKILMMRRVRLGQLLRSTAGLVVACMLVSCATINSHTTQYVGAPHPPPTDPGWVEILRTTPTRAHERIGEVKVDASTNPAPPVAEVETRLRKEAAKIGADAVVVVYDRIQPVGAYVSGSWWGGSVSTISGRVLIGVAIQYKQ
jgi:hypothetical protein